MFLGTCESSKGVLCNCTSPGALSEGGNHSCSHENLHLYVRSSESTMKGNGYSTSTIYFEFKIKEKEIALYLTERKRIQEGLVLFTDLPHLCIILGMTYLLCGCISQSVYKGIKIFDLPHRGAIGPSYFKTFWDL